MMYALPDTVYTLPPIYGETFFSGDSLLHPELSVSPFGIQAVLQPFTMYEDDFLVTSTILIGAFAIALFHGSRHFLRQQRRNFFLPLSSQRSKDLYDMSQGTCLLYTLLMILSGTFLCFFCQRESFLFCHYREVWLTLAQIALTCIIYFLLKGTLMRFVNWTFFSKEQRDEWQKNYAFLLAMEALALTPLQLISVHTNLSIPIAFLCTSVIILAVKIPLLYKGKVIFFPNFYGYLHLIVYFCGVEIGPMAILWVALTRSEQIFY